MRSAVECCITVMTTPTDTMVDAIGYNYVLTSYYSPRFTIPSRMPCRASASRTRTKPNRHTDTRASAPVAPLPSHPRSPLPRRAAFPVALYWCRRDAGSARHRGGLRDAQVREDGIDLGGEGGDIGLNLLDDVERLLGSLDVASVTTGLHARLELRSEERRHGRN